MTETLVVIPTFNEAENIASLLIRMCELYPSMHVLVVDDSPNDETIAEIIRAQESYADRIHFIHRKGKGRGSAVLDGFKWGTERAYEYFFEMDADFSHEPTEAKFFLEEIYNADLVLGSRYLPKSEIHKWGKKRTILSALANRFAKFVLRIPISDYTNGYRCYNRRAVEFLLKQKIDAEGYVVLSEVAYLLHKNDFKIVEVPTVFVNRQRGISNLSIHEISEAFFSVLRIRSPRLYRHARQFVKFGIAGALGAVLDLGSLSIFVEVFMLPENVSFVLSTVLAMTLVFLFNKYITFKSHNQLLVTQGLRFLLVYSCTALLNVGLSVFFLTIGMYYLLSKAAAIGIIMLVNYAFSHIFIFSMKRADPSMP